MPPAADKRNVARRDRDRYLSWIWEEVVLLALLGASLALFVSNSGLRNTYALPEVRLAVTIHAPGGALLDEVLVGAKIRANLAHPTMALRTREAMGQAAQAVARYLEARLRPAAR